MLMCRTGPIHMLCQATSPEPSINISAFSIAIESSPNPSKYLSFYNCNQLPPDLPDLPVFTSTHSAKTFFKNKIYFVPSYLKTFQFLTIFLTMISTLCTRLILFPSNLSFFLSKVSFPFIQWGTGTLAFFCFSNLPSVRKPW